MKIKFQLYNLAKNDKIIFGITIFLGVFALLPLVNSWYYFGMIQSTAFAATGTTFMALFTFLFSAMSVRREYYERIEKKPILYISNKKVKGDEVTFNVKNIGQSAATNLKLVTEVHLPNLNVKYDKQNNIIGFSERGFWKHEKGNETKGDTTIINDLASAWYGLEPLTILKPNEKTTLKDTAYIEIQRKNKRCTDDLNEIRKTLRRINKRYASVDLYLRYNYLDEVEYKHMMYLIFDREKHTNLEDAWKASKGIF